MRKITWVPAAMAILFAAPACDKADFHGAEAEVKKIEANLDLPPVPEFDMPHPSGSAHTPRELRLMGAKLLNSEIEVKGFVTYKYNCLTDGGPAGPVGGLDADEKAREKLIKEEPQKWCYKPWIVLNDVADGNPAVGLWVTFDEYTSLFNKRMSKRDNKLTKEEKDALAVVEAYDKGQEIDVTGKFALSSPDGFGNSNGLLILKNDLPQPEAPSPLP